MPRNGRQTAKRVTIVSLLPKNATPAQVEEAERKLGCAKNMATLTPSQVRKLQEHAYRGGKYDGKGRRNRTRRARRESAIREQE